MKKRILLFLALLLAPVAFAQTYGGISGYATLGGTKANVSGLPSTNYQQGIVPSAIVTVYNTGTTNLATIYSNNTGTHLSNPFTAVAAASSNSGFWQFFAAINQGFDVCFSGGVAPNVFPAPVCLTALYPTQSITPFTGVVSISNGTPVNGAILFSGNAVSQSGQTFTFTAPVQSLTTTGTTGAASLSGGVLNIPQYQGALTLTTTGSTGAATLIGNTLNIPNYASGSSNGVQYNDPNTAYVWMADSSIGSDDHALSATITITSSAYVGSGSATTVTFTNSGNNGLAALQTQFGTAWVDTQGLTSPSFLNTGNCITSYNMAATGVCIFPVTVIDSTHFSISYPTNEGSGSGTSGSIYTANWYLPIYVQNTQPYFNGHGLVAEKTQIIYTASLTSTFTADFAALAPVNTGHPGWIIHSNDQDVYFTASTGSCTAAAIEGYYQNVWAQAHALGYKWAEATTRAGSQNTSVSACSGATGIWQTVENWKRQQKCNASGAPAQTQCFDALIDQWGITGGEQSTPYQTGGRLTYAGIALLASKFNDAMVAQGSPSPTMVEGLIPNGGGWDVNTYNVSGSALRICLNFACDFTWDTNAHSSFSPIVGFSGFGGGNPPTSGQMTYTTGHQLLFNDQGVIKNLLSFATLSPLTTKGDLLGFSTVNARVPVGTDAFVLTADSSQALGVKWAAASGGLSGMTAGQVPIAATATTATSSEALAGAGAGITTGPVSATTANDIVTMNGTNGQIKDSGTLITALAPIASPTFTGVPAAPTATGGTSTTQLATTAFVQAAIAAAGTGAGIVTYSGPSITFTGTQYFPIGGGATSSTTETNVDIDSPAAVTIQNMTVQMSAAPGIGNSVVYTWRKNASGTVLTCTISGSSATSCSDTTHNFSTAALDLLDIQTVTTGTIVGTPTVVMAAQVGVGVTGSVSQFSGDGALLSNSASTGPVTATLANAAANTVWGNETGGSTTPSYGKLALPTIATQANDTVDMNASGSTASPTAVAMPTCTTGADLYNTSTHSWSCVSAGGTSTNLCAVVTLTNATCSSGVITITASSASATISAIPGTYSNLHFIIKAVTSSGSTDQFFQWQFNADTGSNYGYSFIQNSNYTGGVNAGGSNSTTAGQMCDLSVSTNVGVCTVDIQFYADAKFKEASAGGEYFSTGNSVFTRSNWGMEWKSTAAITSIVLTPTGSTNVSYATILMYGEN